MLFLKISMYFKNDVYSKPGKRQAMFLYEIKIDQDIICYKWS